MKKILTGFIAGLLLIQPYAQAQEQAMPPDVLHRTLEERFTGQTRHGGWILRRNGTGNPSWIKGEIRDHYLVLEHFKILNRKRYAEIKVDSNNRIQELALRAQPSYAATGLYAGSIGLGAGLTAGITTKLIFRAGLRRAFMVGQLAGIGAVLAAAVPLLNWAAKNNMKAQTAYMAAYQDAYQSAWREPETWSVTVGEKTQLVGTFDENPPLTSPAHPIQIQLASVKEEGLYHSGYWFPSAYIIEPEKDIVAFTIAIDAMEFAYIEEHGYADVRMDVVNPNDGSVEKILGGRKMVMTRPAQIFTVPSQSVCPFSLPAPYYREIHLWVSPRTQEGAPMREYDGPESLRAVKASVSCQGTQADVKEPQEYFFNESGIKK